MHSQEDQSVFTINGIQTMSGDCYNLLAESAKMADIGVDIIRLSPETPEMDETLSQFRAALAGELESIPLLNDDSCNGYWYGEPGMLTHS